MKDNRTFRNLKKLFSTDVVIRNVGGNQLKVFDINKLQQTGKVTTNSLIDRYRRIRTHQSTSLLGYNQSVNYQHIRPQLYSEYDLMDTDAIISSALDIVADESTLKNDMGEVISIKSSDENIQKSLDNLFYDVLNIEFNLWPWIRNMTKYGDFFLKLEISEKYGIYNVIPHTAYTIERLEGFDEDNPNTVKYIFNPDGVHSSHQGFINVPSLEDNSQQIVYDNFEVAHFRLINDINFLPYGRSFIEPARHLYKQYSLMEDAMLVHRIVRAPEKRIYYLNVGSIPPNEIDAFMENTISELKRTPYIDEKTGEYNLRYNFQNSLEDYFLPVRGGDNNSTRVETLDGLQWDGIEDVEYLRDKLFAALKVPKAFMGYDEHTDGKATLAAQDIRFARTIERIQRIVTSELNKIALIHLYVQGYRDEQLSDFKLSLTTPSIIYDQERVALLQEKVALARDLIDIKLLPTDWIYENIFHLGTDEYDEYRDLIAEDQRRTFRYTQIEDEGNDPEISGKSYGTPHDLATLYGTDKGYSTQRVPPGYDEHDPNPPKLGRKPDKGSKMNTQASNFGKDRLGRKGMKDDYNNPVRRRVIKESESIKKGLKEKYNLNKEIIFNPKDKGSSLLDESLIREYGD